MTVRTQVDGPVTTVVLDRPESPNAVDRASKAMDNRVRPDGDGPMGPTRLRLGTF